MASIRYPGENPLRSEAEAWAFLDWLKKQPAQALLEEASLGTPSWANFNLHYEGAAFNATLTPPMMEALLTLQSGIYRSYALIKYGTERASKLTDQDKHNTQIVVSVKPGTTGLDIDGTKIGEHFIDVVGHTMNGVEVTIAVVSALVLFFGYSGVKLVMAEIGKTRARQIEATERASERAEDVRQAIALSQEETKRTEILREITDNFPKVAAIQEEIRKVTEAALTGCGNLASQTGFETIQ